jgi:hypothetical protein
MQYRGQRHWQCKTTTSAASEQSLRSRPSVGILLIHCNYSRRACTRPTEGYSRERDPDRVAVIPDLATGIVGDIVMVTEAEREVAGDNGPEPEQDCVLDGVELLDGEGEDDVLGDQVGDRERLRGAVIIGVLDRLMEAALEAGAPGRARHRGAPAVRARSTGGPAGRVAGEWNTTRQHPWRCRHHGAYIGWPVHPHW